MRSNEAEVKEIKSMVTKEMFKKRADAYVAGNELIELIDKDLVYKNE